MKLRYYYPLDPECPGVQAMQKDMDSLMDDPMTAAYGAPVDDIAEGRERTHRATCKRCQAYGARRVEEDWQ